MKRERIKDIRISILDYIIWFLAVIVISFAVSLITAFIVLKAKFSAIMYVLSHPYVIWGTILLSLVSYIPFIYVMYTQYERNYVLRRLRSMRQGIDGNLENSHFINQREMEKNEYRICNTLQELQAEEDGIILNCADTKKGLKTIISPTTIHTLVLGTTGSGKTTAYIIPSIKALANTKTKPSFLFTDPKGELSEQTAWFLREQGYDVKILDFRRPERSLRWNPLAYAYDKYQQAQNTKEQATFDGTKYIFNGESYTVDEIENAIFAEEQRLEDEAFEEVQNIVSAICPINERDPIWDNGARALIQAVTLAMLEDSIDSACEVSKEQFCFYNVAKICQKTDNNCAELKKYFQYRNPTSLAVQYSGMVLNAPDKQMGSYMSSVAEKLLMFNDRGICNMTSGKGEIDVREMDERPTAVYLVLPDEKEGRHPLGSLFIAEAYKKLVEKAIANGGTLKRRVYFMMDEYGNMPKINGVASMYTVGRSRGIIQIPVIQSYSQIIDKYGAEQARTIFGNCNIEIFIGAKDDETCEKFSKKLGNYTVLSTGVSGVGQRRDFEHNFNESLKERPLMYPRELTLLNNKKDMGNIVAINQGYSPSLGKITPSFKSKTFAHRIEAYATQAPRALDEETVLYHFEQRAEKIEREYAEYEAFLKENNGKEKEVKEKEIKNDNSIDEVLRRLQPFAKALDKTFTENTQENLTIIEEIVAYYRAEKALVKLNQVVKLKMEYEKALSSKDNSSIEEK